MKKNAYFQYTMQTWFNARLDQIILNGIYSEAEATASTGSPDCCTDSLNKVKLDFTDTKSFAATANK